MRALIQRVHWAEVEVAGIVAGQVRQGLLVYSAVAPADTITDAEALAMKIATLRIFADEEGKLNRSLQDVRGGVLAISNFTLLADARKGRRPAFAAAAPGGLAQPLHEAFVHALRKQGVPVACGVFGADMIIRSAADGPVNIVLDVPDPARADAPAADLTSACDAFGRHRDS